MTYIKLDSTYNVETLQRIYVALNFKKEDTRKMFLKRFVLQLGMKKRLCLSVYGTQLGSRYKCG